MTIYTGIKKLMRIIFILLIAYLSAIESAFFVVACVLFAILYVLDVFYNKFIFKKKALNIRFNKSKRYRAAIIVNTIFGISFIILGSVFFDFNLSVFFILTGIAVLFEVFFNSERDILITEKFIGSRHRAVYLKWNRITNYSIKNNTLEIWTPYRILEIDFNYIPQDDKDKIICELNFKLAKLLQGKLTLEDKLYVEKLAHHNN